MRALAEALMGKVPPVFPQVAPGAQRWPNNSLSRASRSR